MDNIFFNWWLIIRTFLIPLFIYFFSISQVHSEILNVREKKQIYKSLNKLPLMRKKLWEVLYSSNNYLSDTIKSEIETLLKVAFIKSSISVSNLDENVLKLVDIPRSSAAFHKQKNIGLIIKMDSNNPIIRENNKIRLLENKKLFTKNHNLFIRDLPISRDLNALILFFHEVSHVAYDYYLEHNFEYVFNVLSETVDQERLSSSYYKHDEKIYIDEELYDFLTEKYAFELEYRVNLELENSMKSHWPPWVRFDELISTNPKTKVKDLKEVDYKEVILSFVNRHYDISQEYLSFLPLSINKRLLQVYRTKNIENKISCNKIINSSLK